MRRRRNGTCDGSSSRTSDIPAKGEYGLFAQRKMERGEHIIDYLGLVTLKGNESKTSDYTASFGDDNELALDAELMGNEARMINDFRNTGKRANALFDQYRDAAGDLKLGVFAGPHGVNKADEVLVSYGKGFWENRLGVDGGGKYGRVLRLPGSLPRRSGRSVDVAS